MANNKSAKKRIQIAERNRLINKSYKSTVKTLTKKTLENCEKYKKDPNKDNENLVKTSLNKGEISFLHSGHLGDIVNSLSVIKELSKSHKCNLYLETNKKLEKDAIGYKNKNDEIYLNSSYMYNFFFFSWLCYSRKLK